MIRCPACQRLFRAENDLAQHAKFRHRGAQSRAIRDDEDSLADLAIEAEQKRASGELLNDLERSLLS